MNTCAFSLKEFELLLACLASCDKQCPSFCTLEYNPVTARCKGGTVTMQFSNRCRMDVHNCEQGDDCKVISSGEQS
ncbi:vasotab-like [Schistocerca cancellata]|uniref:vasotab-like n=1 Tax=Schistocerca cancellata TaxID=274614 RepID=UPI0021191F49|nr:vasotab-like [Schistocerca cancellata]